MKRFLVVALVVTVLVWPVMSTAAFIDTFEAYAVGTPAESIALSGATMGSPFEPNAWQIQENTGDYILLNGKILAATGACDPGSPGLNISFDDPQTFISFKFGAEPAVDVIKLDGWMGTPGPGTLQFSH
ncbi:MAG: hypothetical protein GYB65_07270, partial [Chloroflexi bacterium]|nr:hypothetical protein [Chloroflexota bacterium]